MSEAHATQPAILVIEDDPDLVDTLRQVLTDSGYQVRVAGSWAEARTILERLEPELILLDLVLPDADGLVLAAMLKTLRSTPIIIMSARAQQVDRVLGLKLGADDFVAKPFDVEELMARVEAVLRRATPKSMPASSDRISVGALTLVPSRGLVTLGTEEVHLTAIEYRLLSALASHVDEVLSREALLKQVWGYQDPAAWHIVDVQVGRLRKKLRRGRLPGPQIVTVRGSGFKLASEPAGQPPGLEVTDPEVDDQRSRARSAAL